VSTVTVLIVDDSPSVRAVLRRFLSRTPEIRVLGEAADGEAAITAVERLRPDVLLLDLVMPKLDGFAVLERLARTGPVPTVILTSRANRSEVRSAFEALRAGAVELLPKPEDPDSWRHLSETLPRVLRAAAAVERPERGKAAEARIVAPRQRPAVELARESELRWLALGASTGGPAALRDLLAMLPAPPPTRTLVVQHIARGFEDGLADWLAGSLGLDVRVAVEGERPRPGTVRIAPAGAHLLVGAEERLTLDAATPTRRGHRPSVDELFHSLALSAPRDTAAVVLTGMGSDGAEGLAELRKAGALCFAQDEASSAVYGMPKAAVEAGGAEVVAPPRTIGEMLARRLGERS
jgi:two-component system chemotaxis response regulator CheB